MSGANVSCSFPATKNNIKNKNLKRRNHMKSVLAHKSIPAMAQRPAQVKELRFTLANTSKRRRRGTNTPGSADPIRDRAVVSKILEYFLTHDNGTSQKSFGVRNFALAMFAFNTGRRAGDILKLRLGDVYDPQSKSVKESLTIKEAKTGKSKKLHLNEALRKALLQYILSEREYDPVHEPLFASRQRDSDGSKRPITIQWFWNLLKEVQSALGIDGNMSTHTCRKTFARQVLEAHKHDAEVLAMIQELLNHSNISMTRRYLGLTDELQRELYITLNLGDDLTGE